MASGLDHGLVRTAAVEQVVAPIASHLCHLVLLCDGAEEAEQFSRLEEAAQAVAKATEHMAAEASRHISDTEDEVLLVEMSSLLESVTVSGQHVLLAAQKLSIQPGVTEHRDELIAATQGVFLGVVQVLLLDDDATVRRVVAAADGVLQSLSELGSSADIKSLLRSFHRFSDALLFLNSLTVERANSLQDPRQKQQLLDCLQTLRRCISMLHTAMCTTIKHPSSEQAQEAKRYILDKVQSTVADIIATLRSECHTGPLGSCGYYTERRNRLLHILTDASTSSIRASGFDSLVRDLVFHCMLVANSSRRELRQTVVGHCRHVLRFWSDVKRILKCSEDPDDPQQGLEESRTLLMQQTQMLDRALMSALLHQVLDTLLTASSIVGELLRVTREILVAHSSAKMDLSFIQPLVEDFISSTDRIIQVAHFMCAVAADAKGLENVENSRACLSRLRARIAPLSLELEEDSMQTVQKLHELCQKWEEEISQLQDALSDVVDVREFTSIAVDEMIGDRRGCDAAYREQSYERFDGHAANLVCHMKLAIRSVRRHLDRSDDPIYRNGLLVLLKQVQTSQSKVGESAADMLSGSSLNVDVYSTFSDSVSMALQHFKVLRQGLDGQQHPHLLSPLREAARRPDVSPPCLPVEEINLDDTRRAADSPVLDVMERDFQTEPEEEQQRSEETPEAEVAYEGDGDDLMIPAVSDGPRLIHKPLDFDLLPLLYEVVTVTKGKDVTALNRACTTVLELSNCYAQAAKEALAVVDAVDRQTLESFRAELVSLTPLLVQTAQETAMSSAMSTDSIYKHSTQFSDLISNTRRVLLPVAGSWYHSVYTELQGSLPTAASLNQQLNDVMTLCADVVQLLTSTDLTSQSDSQETFGVLHNKLNKAQNNTRSLLEFCASAEGKADQLEGLCILWGLSVQILLNSLDKILGTSAAVSQLGPRKQLSALSENSLRIQEAARLTSLNCRSAYKSKRLTGYQDELKTLTDSFLKAAEEVDLMPSVMQLAKSEFLQRHLLIKIRVLSGHLSKANKDYDAALQKIASVAYSAAERFRENDAEDAEQRFEEAAQALLENVKLATKKVEDCFNYIRNPRARCNLRSINDHLSFQISDIISRARLMVETHFVCDTLSLEVQIQCWSAKAHYVVEEIMKQDGIHQEAKEQIRAALQGGEVSASAPFKAKEVEFPSDVMETTEKGITEGRDAADTNVIKREKQVLGFIEKEDAAQKDASLLTYTSLFLKQESDSWDPKDNRIVQVTKKMADTLCYMTQYLKKKGPIPNKEAFVSAAKDVISSCQSVTQFIRVIANHCLDKQCTVELSLIVEQIVTITSQLSIISSVNAVTPGCKSSDEILVKNTQNLLQTVLRGVHAAETACITGLKQPEPDSDGAEATALCFQWRRKLEIHRAQQTSNPETDELGLRKTSSHPEAPSLAVNVKDGFK